MSVDEPVYDDDDDDDDDSDDDDGSPIVSTCIS